MKPPAGRDPRVLRVGVTGTRSGITLQQRITLTSELTQIVRTTPLETQLALHYGDCIGADAEAFSIARPLGFWTVAHPPTHDKFRAFTRPDKLRDPQPYLERDRAIVREVTRLIVLPSGYKNVKRGSGTWYTYREAQRVGVPTLIIWPDGQTSATHADRPGDGNTVRGES